MSTNDQAAYRAAHFVGRSEDGQRLLYRSTLTPESDTCRTLIVCRPDQVVPIVFVPGIMGSNLRASQDIKNAEGKVVIKAKSSLWRVDSAWGMLKDWALKGPDEYQLRLRHSVTEVDPGGDIPASGLQCQAAQNSAMAPAPLSAEQLRERGWGEVSAMFYLPFLDWLEHQLNYAGKDFTRQNAPDNVVLQNIKQRHIGAHPLGTVSNEKSIPPLSAQDIDSLLSCDNPVHAVGYNWLQSNAQSGQALKDRIEKIIQSYKDQGKQCEQVILVTHSMGGLVARAACKLRGAEDLVAGVFHSVMPTDGAAATYKRMVSGFGGEEGGGLLAWIKGWVSANILGPRANFTTPTLALNAGPLELLPNKRYNESDSWLFVQDAAGQTLALPKKGGDPYSEIYTEQQHWWKLCNEAWMNPAGLKDAGKFDDYGSAVLEAGKFHKLLHTAGDFHPVTYAHYGNDDQHKAYGTVTWKLDQTLTPEQQASLRRNDLGDADMGITLAAGEGASALKVQATLSAPDVPGDGTVPAKASAERVQAAALMCVTGKGYGHDASYDTQGHSEGPGAALHAVLHILKSRAAA